MNAKAMVILALAALSQACASTNVPSFEESKSIVVTEEDEKQLWSEADSLESKLGESRILYEDPGLEAYLNRVSEKVLPPNLKVLNKRPRIKVVKNPLLNAFTMPNGLICLHSGFLVRVETEDQLATVISHEIVHFSNRHTLKQARNTTNKTSAAKIGGVFLAFVVGAAGGGPVVPSLIDQMVTGWLTPSMQGYSQKLEAEADAEGYVLMTKAGYDSSQAVRVFELLQQELDGQGIKEPFFYGTHPRLQERIQNYRNLANQHDSTKRSINDPVGQRELQKHINPLYLVNAELDLSIGRVNTAHSAISKYLKSNPKNAHAYYLLGEVYRRKGAGRGDFQDAMRAYQTAAEIDPQYPDPHRELGLIFRAAKNEKYAQKELELYLSLNPKAPDAPIIKGYLKEFADKKG